MAVSRNSTANGTDDSSSFNVTIAGSIVIAFITYTNSKTLNTATLNGVNGTVLQTGNLPADGYKVAAVSFIGTFTGSQAVVLTWTGGTPANIRSKFLGYSGSSLVDVSNIDVSTGGSVSATVTQSNCWIIGFSATTTGAGAGNPTTGTNNDGYFVSAGTNDGLLRYCIGDSNGTVTSGSRSVTTTTTGGFTYATILVAIYGKQANSLSFTKGDFAYTGYAATLFKTISYVLSLAFGSFSYTGYALAFAYRTFTRYVNQVKNAISPTNATKQSNSTFTNQSKNSITPTNQTKS